MEKLAGGRATSESCCQRCCRYCFNLTIFITLLFFSAIIGLHSYTSGYSFLLKPSMWSLLEGFSYACIILFAVMYGTAGLVICKRWYQTRRLCRLDNCMFYFLSVVVFVLSLVGKFYIDRA